MKAGKILVMLLCLLLTKARGQNIQVIQIMYLPNDTVGLKLLSHYFGDINNPPTVTGVVKQQQNDTLNVQIYFTDPTTVGNPTLCAVWKYIDLGQIIPSTGINYVRLFPFKIGVMNDTTVGYPVDTTLPLSWLTAIDNIVVNSEAFIVYPNPVGNVLSVALKQHELTGDIVITDLTSKLMYIDRQRRISTTPFSVDVSDLPNGLLFLNLYQGNSSVYMKCFLKR